MSIHVLVGYRQMTSCIRQRHTVPASRQQVAECLRVLDPSASDARRSSKLVCGLARTNLSVHIKKISIDFIIFDGFISFAFYLPSQANQGHVYMYMCVYLNIKIYFYYIYVFRNAVCTACQDQEHFGIQMATISSRDMDFRFMEQWMAILESCYG